MEFNSFDIIVLSITLILAIKGFFNGLIKEISGLVGIVLGIYLGSLYYKEFGSYINESIIKIPNESAINVVGFVGVFILTWFLFFVLGFLFSKIVQIAQLGILDRIGGVIFSAGKFFVIVAVIVTMLSQIEAMHKQVEKWSKNSVTYPYLIKVGNAVMKFNPDDIKKELKKKDEESGNDKNSTDLKEIINKNVDKIKEKLNNSINDDNLGDKITKKIEETKKKVSETIDENLKKENKGD